MSTSPIIITPSTSVVLVNTGDYSGNPVVLLPNLAGPGALGRIITVRDNDGGSVDPAKSIYLSTTGGARFQAELSTVTLSTIRITQPYGFITLTPRLVDGSGNTNYGLMNVYAFPEASPAAYINTFNANFSYLSTLSTANLAVSQDTIIQGNLTIGGGITYVTPGSNTLNINRINANTISVASLLNSNFYGVNAAVSTINTSSFVVRDAGSILLPNAGSWSNAASFAGAVDANSFTLGNPTASAGAQIGVASNFFGMRSFSQSASLRNYSTTVVMRDRNVGINPVNINIGEDYNNFSNYRLYVNGAVRLSNEGLGLENDILLRKQTNSYSSIVEVTDFGPNLGTFRIDSSSNITEGFFGSGSIDNKYKWLSVDKAGSIQFWTGSSTTLDTTSRVTIDNAGRMGVGTTNPGQLLDVNGVARINAISTPIITVSSIVGSTIAGTLGSATIPSYTFVGDTNTGLFSPGADSLAVTTGGTQRMVVNGSGNVGIGTTNPATFLTVRGSSSSSAFAAGNRFGDATNNGQFFIEDGTMSGRRLAMGYSSQDNIAIIQSISSGVSVMPLAINPAGNTVIGVNNCNLSYTLQTGDTYLTTGSNAVDAGGTLAFGVAQFPTASPMSQIKGVLINAPTFSELQGGIAFSTRPNGTAGQTMTERMRITSVGNVGIGTTAPDTTLDVRGTGKYVQSSSGAITTATPGLFVENAIGSHNIGFYTNMTAGAYNSLVSAGDKGIIYSGGYIDSGASFVIGPHDSSAKGIRINGSGDVGIGCNAPSVKLDVNGSTKITGDLNVTGTITGTLSVVPTGCIMMWSTGSSPSGWLLCDGSAISRTTYALLFGVITTTYGAGDGSTTFNVPDMKGRVPVGRDAVQTEFDTLGETGGAKTHTLTEAEMPSHTHDYKFPTGQSAQGGGSDTVAEDNFSFALTKTSVATGGGGAHNNLQPYLVLNYIIKT